MLKSALLRWPLAEAHFGWADRWDGPSFSLSADVTLSGDFEKRPLPFLGLRFQTSIQGFHN